MAGRYKGTPKTGGRAKGVPNKDTRTLHEICDRLKINPFEALLHLYSTTRNEGIKLGALSQACKYIFPQLKAIDHSGEIKNPFADKPLEELRALVKEKLKE